MSSSASLRSTFAAFLVLIVLIVLGGGLLLLSRPQAARIVIVPPQPTATPATVWVYVSGEVERPYTVLELPNGSRVQQAIDGAGGLTELADRASINPVGILHDGDRVHVAARNAADGAGALPTLSAAHIIYLNSADSAALQSLPGIGPVMAGRILRYRQVFGRFAGWDELGEVPGLGEAALKALRGRVSFD